MKLALGLGSSLGERRRLLERALAMLAARPQHRLLRTSRWYRTPPMRGGTARGWFLNGVALFDTTVEPEAFLGEAIALERRFGRRRARWWGDRTLDLDVLLVEGRTQATESLILPHPAIGARAFVLTPLLEVWPDARDPITGTAYADLPVPGGPRPVPIGVLARRATAV